MADFRMASSRVGADGGTALAQGLAAGEHPSMPRSGLMAASDEVSLCIALSFITLL